MTTILFDTDTLIALLRGREELAEKVRACPPGAIGISTVSYYELMVGIEKSGSTAKKRKSLEDALAPFAIYPFDPQAATEAATLRAHLEKERRGIGPYDTLIAGHALALKAKLITANTREFSRIPQLKLENWLE